MTEKSTHYNCIKVLATFLVVLGHSSRMYTDKGVVEIANGSNFLVHVCDFIYSFHMPLFIAVSGMIFGICVDDYQKYKNIKKFIINKSLRLMVPYFFWGLFLVAPIMCFWDFDSKSYVDYCLYNIFALGDSRHLWFMVVLFEIFILCAVFRFRIPTNWFSFLLLFAISCVSNRIPDVIQLNNLCYYLIFFFLGYVINRFYSKIVLVLKKPYILLVFIIAMIVLFRYNARPIKVIKAVSGVGLFFGLTGYMPNKSNVKRWIDKFNKNGFGVYIFHPMIIYLLYFYFGDWNIHPILLFFLIALVSYIISFLFTVIIRKMHFGVLIGEKTNRVA